MNRQDKKEAQARAVAQLRKLTKNLESLDRNGDLKTTQAVLTEHIQDGDKMYPIIKKKLHGSAADAKHMKQLLHVSCATAKRINSTSKCFSLLDRANKLKRLHKPEISQFYAKEHASSAICYAPTFEFFYGAIRQEGLIIKPRKKRAKVQLDDRNISSIKATERNIHTDCEQDSTPKEVDAIHEKIRDLAKDKPSGVSLLTAIVDPHSYAHTVENIFHTAFLVKEGKVGVRKGPGSKPMIEIVGGGESQQSRNRPANQSILSFSMTDYERWVEALERQDDDEG